MKMVGDGRHGGLLGHMRADPFPHLVANTLM
jgi:hypothetical protein